MPTRPLGRTGCNVSLLALNGGGVLQGASDVSEDRASSLLRSAIESGVSLITTAPALGDGRSEERVGRAVAARREEVFLATCTHDCSYAGTLRSCEQSLKRLQTDRIDLYLLDLDQLQNAQELDAVLSASGGRGALDRLRDEKIIRFIGIAGKRKASLLLRSIQSYPFDVLQMSLNAADVHTNPHREVLLKTADEKGLGIIAADPTASNRVFSDSGVSSFEDALGYVYSFPVSCSAVNATSMVDLEQAVLATRQFDEPFPTERLLAIEEATSFCAADL